MTTRNCLPAEGGPLPAAGCSPSGTRRPLKATLLTFTNNTPRSSSSAPPPQLGPPRLPGYINVGVSLIGVNRPRLCRFSSFRRQSARSTGVRPQASCGIRKESSSGGGAMGLGCVRAACSPGTWDGGMGCSVISHSDSPVSRLRMNTKPCLVSCTSAGMLSPSRCQLNRMGWAGVS